MPAITVAIPAYKPRFLRQAIDSVLRQTFEDFELLISDDRMDGSISEVVQQYDDPRIRLLKGPGRGLVPNSVSLWERAQADLLKFLYDDDLLYPDALAELQGAMQRRPDAVYAYCRRVFIDESGAEVGRWRSFDGDDWVWFDPPTIPNYLIRQMFNGVGEPSNILIRRSALGESSCLSQFEGLPIRHLIDVAFYMNAGLKGPCVAIPGYLAAFRRHEEQVSAQRTSPAFSAGIFEWEIFLRAGVRQGLITQDAGIDGVDALDALYSRYLNGFPELSLLRRRLPVLKDQLQAGDREVVTAQFLDDLQVADQLISTRRAASLPEHT